MATRKYSISLGQSQDQVVEAVGGATTGTLDVTVDFGAALGGCKSVSKDDFDRMMIQIAAYVQAHIWPPA